MFREIKNNDLHGIVILTILKKMYEQGIRFCKILEKNI